VYGERGKEDHAVMAMIARAFVEQSPFLVWGNGEQVRNWTYVGDIVRGTILAAERIDDGTAVNLGTMERTRVIDAVREVLRYTGKELEIEFQPEMPTGPMNRVADNARARQLLGWEPQMSFREGLHRTIDWYFAEKEPVEVRELLEQGGLIAAFMSGANPAAMSSMVCRSSTRRRPAPPSAAACSPSSRTRTIESRSASGSSGGTNTPPAR